MKRSFKCEWKFIYFCTIHKWKFSTVKLSWAIAHKHGNVMNLLKDLLNYAAALHLATLFLMWKFIFMFMFWHNKKHLQSIEITQKKDIKNENLFKKFSNKKFLSIQSVFNSQFKWHKNKCFGISCPSCKWQQNCYIKYTSSNSKQ